MKVGGSRKKKRKKEGRDNVSTLFCPTPLIFKRIIYREGGRYREQNKSGRRRRWLCAVLFDAEEKNEIEDGQRVTKKKKKKTFCELCDYFF